MNHWPEVFEYQFDGVSPGEYFVVSGTDLDNDGLICDAGEACGAFPTVALPSSVRITNEDVTGVDFVGNFDPEISLLSVGAPR